MFAEYEYEIDATGLRCPLPVLKFKKLDKLLPGGAVVRVIATDPDSVKDFTVLCQMKGYQILEIDQVEDTFVIVIQINKA